MQHMVSCKQVTWMNKQMKMVHGVVESNIYILSSSMLWAYKPETCRAKINKYCIKLVINSYFKPNASYNHPNVLILSRIQ